MKDSFAGFIIFLQQHRIGFMCTFLALTVVAVVFITNNLGMNTDTKDMLSGELNWRKLDRQYEALFPQYTGNILVVIESPTPDQSADAAIALYRALIRDGTLFKDIYYPEYLDYLRQSSLLFLDADELHDLSDQLAKIQPFLGALVENPSIQGLFQMLSGMLDAIEEGREIDLAPLVDEMNLGLESLSGTGLRPMSWHKLMSGKNNSQNVYREFIILRPHLDYSKLFPARDAIEFIRLTMDALDLDRVYGVNVGISGNVALSHEELESVSKANWVAISLALVIVTILLIFGLGSLGVVFACMTTLICGLIFTTAFAAATVGELNLISVAFAVLYIGLGIDFAIHYCVRFREYFIIHQDTTGALIHSTRAIFRSLLLCSLTTAIGFFAFIPTNYTGVAELGWIAGNGMFISFILTFTLLPVLLSYTKFKCNTQHTHTENLPKLPLLSDHNAKIVVGVTGILAGIVLLQLSSIEFDTNTLNLQDQSNESVETYKSLLDDGAASPWAGLLLVKGKSQAKIQVDKYEELDAVNKVVWLDKFIPADQEEKLAIIEEINLLMGGGLLSEGGNTISDVDKWNALKNFHARLENMTIDDERLHQLYANIDGIINESKNDGVILTRVEKILLQSFPGRIELLRDALEAEYVTPDVPPDSLKARWVNNHYYKIDLYPKHDISDDSTLEQFVYEIRQLNPNVIGAPIINFEAGIAVSNAFQHAFLYAFAGIVLLLFIVKKSLRDTLIITISLLIGALLTAGLMLVFNISMNFANIIALPLLLGIGVDSGIHILERYRAASNASVNILYTSTSRAVIISALTTICSIGNLALSSHYGMASMGLLLVTGIVSMVFSMLIFMPALLLVMDSMFASE